MLFLCQRMLDWHTVEGGEAYDGPAKPLANSRIRLLFTRYYKNLPACRGDW